MSYRFKKSSSVVDNIRRIAREQIDGALADSQASAVEKAVHEVRKRGKKLRALLRLVRPMMAAAARAENGKYRDMGRRLSGARDAEVLLATFEQVVQEDDTGDRQTVEAVRAHLTTQRDALRSDDPTAVLQDVRSELEGAKARVDDWTLKKDEYAALQPGLRQSYRRGRKALKAVLADPTPERAHAWRKRVKDLAYHLRLLGNAWKPLTKPQADVARELGEQLGDLHDLDVLYQSLRDELGERETIDLEPLLHTIQQQRDERLCSALAIGMRLYVETPNAFTRRIGGYWAHWRDEPADDDATAAACETAS